MLCNGFFAADHDVVDELGDNLVVKLRIWKNFSLGNYATSWHIVLSFLQVSPEQSGPY